ncbi:MAG: MCP four helix bundle domain-containing protein, partial [Candidatus Kapaibacteriota bacterium]
MKIKTKLTIFGIIMLAIVAIFAYEMNTLLSNSNENLKQTVLHRNLKIKLYNDILDYQNNNKYYMALSIAVKIPEKTKENLKIISENRNKTKQILKQFEELKASSTEEGKKAVDDMLSIDKDYGEAFNKVLYYVENSDYEDAIKTIESEYIPLLKQYQDFLYNELNRQQAKSEEEYNKSQAEFHSAVTLSYILAGISLLVIISFTLWLLTSIGKSINEAVNQSTNLSVGNLNITSNTKIKDETKQILDASEALTKVLKEITAELNTLTNNMLEGKLDYRANPNKFKGEFKNLVEGLNSTVDALVKPMNVTAEYVDRISKGDIPPIITEEYKGDFNEIKNNINLLIESTEKIANDILSLSKGN